MGFLDLIFPKLEPTKPPIRNYKEQTICRIPRTSSENRVLPLAATVGNLLLRVIVVHPLLFLVVSCNSEGNYFQGDQAGGHRQHFGTMGWLIEVLPCLWMRHASRVSSNNIKIGSCYHPCSAMPLDLEKMSTY